MTRTLVMLSLMLWGLGAIPMAAEPVAVSGRIVAREGQAARGATVELMPLPSAFERSELSLEGRLAPEPVARTASRDDGRFELAAPAPGMWQVRVTAPGFVPQIYLLVPLLEPAELPALLLFQKDKPVRVRALDGQGRPVAGAPVFGGYAYEPWKMEGWQPEPQLAITGADGSVRLAVAARGQLQIEALAPGFPRLSLPLEMGQTAADLRLTPGCARTVRVTSPAKAGAAKPVPGALLSTGSSTLGATDETGTLTLTAPCDRDLSLAVQTRDGRRSQTLLRRGPAGGTPVAVSFPAAPSRVSGRVVEDGGARGPVAEALVWMADDPAAFVRTDARGTYTVTATGEKAGLAADALGYLPARDTTRGATGPTLALTPLATVSGTVVDEAGRPVADAVLRAALGRVDWRPGQAPPLPLPPARSGPQGEFRLEVRPGRETKLTASHPRFTSSSLPLPELAPHASRKDVRIVLRQGLTGAGKVVDGTGQPIAGAEVLLAPVRDPNALPSFDASESFTPPATTDIAGRFVVEHRDPGTYNLIAAARGFASTLVPGIELAAGSSQPIDLGTVTLAPGLTLEGFVVDPQGRPIAGAQVLGGGSSSRWVEDGILSAADGSFSIPDLQRGDKVTLSVSKKGYAGARLSDLEVPRAEPLRIVLEPGVRITGRVVNEAGDPLANAAISLFRMDNQLVGSMGPAGSFAAMGRSEADGGFVLEPVKAGKHRIVVIAAGFVEKEVSGLEVAGSDLEDLQIVLSRGAVVAGHVAGPDGKSVAGARVQLVEEEGQFSLSRYFNSGQTDADGNYRLEGMAEGQRSIEVQAEGFQRLARDLEVRAGDNRLDFTLQAGHEVSGRVVDGAGEPVAGARVLLGSGEGDFATTFGGMGSLEDRSAADGSFRIGGVATGSYAVRAEKEGYAPAALGPMAVSGPLQGLKLELVPAGSVRGRLVGAELADLQSVSLAARSRRWEGPRLSQRLGQVDFQGQYRIDGLAAGEWEVEARTESGLSAHGLVTVAAGTEAVLDLELERGLTLTGHVLRGGEPVSGAHVMVISREGFGSGTTDPQGAFRIQGLAAGENSLHLMDFSSGLEHQETVELTGDRDLLVELSTRRMSGRVMDATDQSPLAGAMVSLEPQGENGPASGLSHGSLSGDDGSFLITDVSPGAYRVIARLDGYAQAETTAQVGNDADVDGLRLALQPTQGFTFEARSAVGSPPAQVRVVLLDAAGRTVLSANAATGGNGRVRLASAPAGRWQLLVSASGHGTVSREIQVPAPPNGPQVTLVLPAASTLTVLVPALASGRGTVTLTGEDGRPLRTLEWDVQNEWLLYQGKAVIEGLPPGRWKVLVTAAGGKTWQGTATTSAGGSSQVTLSSP